MRLFALLLFMGLSFLFPLQAEAPIENTPSKQLLQTTPEGGPFSFQKEFTQMILSLLVILALVLVTFWFLKKLLRSRMKVMNGSTGIKILERRALSSKASLYLVDILGKGVVIGESPSGLQLITEFSEETNLEELLLVNNGEPASFPSALKKAFQRLVKQKEPL